MNPTLLLTLVLAVLVTLAGVLAALLLKERARSREALARTRSEAAELRARVDALAAHAAAQDRIRREPEEFVITHLGEPEDEYAAPAGRGIDGRIDGKLFADLVLRESLVKAAALTHGVRRALAPETRNRIRFEMKREIKRAKRSRKDEFRQVRDEMRARARAAR